MVLPSIGQLAKCPKPNCGETIDGDSISGTESADDYDTQQEQQETFSSTVCTLIELAARVVGRWVSCEDLEQQLSNGICLDELLLKKVAYWAFPRDEEYVETIAALCYKDKSRRHGKGMVHEEWQAGCDIVMKDKHSYNITMWQVGFMVSAHILSSEQSSESSLGEQFSDDILLEPGEVVNETEAQTATQTQHNIKVTLNFEMQKITQSSCSECAECWCRHIVAAVLFYIHNPNQVKQHAPITDVLASMNRDQIQKLLQYTIQEDPSYILEKVVKHIDSVRDEHSHMNAVAGAPDPTFGVQDYQLQTQLLCENTFKKQFHDYLQDSTELSTMYCNGCYDWSLKVDSEFHKQFVAKILDLHKGGDSETALKLFFCVIQELLDRQSMQLSTGTSDNAQHIVYTIHDISRLMTLCLLTPRHSDVTCYISQAEQLRNKVCDTQDSVMVTDDLQGSSRSSNGYPGVKSVHSDWAELPHTVLACPQLCTNRGKLTERGEELVDCVFGDILALNYLPPVPLELTRLLDGLTPWKNTDYEENIVLMLLRLESLTQNCDRTNCEQILRLLPVVLRKLSVLAQQYSLLGVTNTWCDAFDLNYAIPALKSASFTTSKNRSKRRKLAKCDSNRSNISEPQICYALLYCLHVKKICEDTADKVYEGPLTTAPFCFLALELSRSRLYENSLCESEQSWLDKLETTIAKQIEVHYDLSGGYSQSALVVEDNNMITWYMDALGSEFEVNFYKHHIPMQLLKILFHLIDKKQFQQTSRVREKIVQICASFVSRIKKAMDEPTVMPLCARSKDFIMVADLVEMFFECINVENNIESLIQMMNDLSGIKYDIVLKRAFSAFYARHFEMDCHHCFVDSSFQFALNAVNINTVQMNATPPPEAESQAACTDDLRETSTSSDRWRENALDHIKKCVRIDGLPALTVINKFQVPGVMYQNTFKSSEMSDIICILKPEIARCDTMSEEVYCAISQCVAEPSDVQVAALLDMFKAEDINSEGFKSLVVTLKRNYKKLSSGKLFTIAKVYDGKRKEAEAIKRRGTKPPLDLSMKLIDETTVELIELAFKQLAEEEEECWFHTCQEEHIRWAYKYCTGDGFDVIWSDTFVQLIDIIQKYGHIHPMVVLLLFDVVDKNELGQSHLATLKKALADAYKNFFVHTAKNIRATGYSKLIQSIQTDKQKFLELFGEKSAVDFDKVVVNGVRSFYKARRRLLKMMDDAFIDSDASTSA